MGRPRKIINSEMNKETGENSAVLESINKKLDAKELEYTEKKRTAKAEEMRLTARIEELERMIEDSANLEEYKATALELKDCKQELNFISTMNKKSKDNKALTDEELKAIKKQIEEEIETIQAEAIPVIQEKFFELIELMDKYTEEIKPFDSVIYKAERLNNPVAPKSKFQAVTIKKINPDKFGYWFNFCQMYYSIYPKAEKIKKGKKPNVWGIY